MATHLAVQAIYSELEGNLPIPVRSWNKGSLNKPYAIITVPNSLTEGSKTGRFSNPRVSIHFYGDNTWAETYAWSEQAKNLLHNRPLNLGSGYKMSYILHDQDFEQPQMIDGGQEIHLISDYRLMIVQTS